jgi:hypothetical protein
LMEPGCRDAVQQLTGFFFRHHFVGWSFWKWIPNTVGIIYFKGSKKYKKGKKPLIKRCPASSQSAGLNPISSLTPVESQIYQTTSQKKEESTLQCLNCTRHTYRRLVLWPKQTRVRYRRYAEDLHRRRRRSVSLESRKDYGQFHWPKGKRLEWTRSCTRQWISLCIIDFNDHVKLLGILKYLARRDGSLSVSWNANPFEGKSVRAKQGPATCFTAFIIKSYHQLKCWCIVK